MELIKENFDLDTIWNCPICGGEFIDGPVSDGSDNGNQLYVDVNCPHCGAHLTIVYNISHVCVFREETD